MKETLKVIRERRTTRKFKAEQIKEEELQAIIEAGLYAPSAHNKQSWNFKRAKRRPDAKPVSESSDFPRVKSILN